MRLFTPKNIVFESEVEQAKFNLIWRLSLVALIVLSALSLVFIPDPSNAKYTYLIGCSFSLFGILYLKLTKKSKAVYIFYAAAGSLLMMIDANVTLDTPHLANYFWIMLVIILSVFGTTLRIAAFFLIVNSLGIIYYTVFTMDKHYHVMNSISDVNSIAVGLELICVIGVISYVMVLFVKTRNLAEKKLLKSNAQLASNNTEILKRDEEKTILVKEIHHRVKNNLQIIISLLRLQMMDIKNTEAKEHFSEAINRVMVMSSIHQKLYQEKNLTDFNLKEYIEELAEELKMFFCEEFPISIDTNVDFNRIHLKTIVPLGLLLNELLSNSFKYAFEDKESGNIKISIKEDGDFFILEYSDDGNWKNYDSEENGFGLELLKILTEQLNGTKYFETNEKGTFYSFNLQSVQDRS
ncbi:MAG: two-component sensor histidine kinase [Arenicella sp.]|jgi:two-component sensor histidine kinase